MAVPDVTSMTTRALWRNSTLPPTRSLHVRLPLRAARFSICTTDLNVRDLARDTVRVPTPVARYRLPPSSLRSAPSPRRFIPRTVAIFLASSWLE